MAFPWAAVASGGSGILGPIISGIFNKKEAEKARDYNTQMLHEQNTRDDINWQRDTEYAEHVWNMQNKYNEQMWHKLNEYNSPMSQMSRYKEAGLNPHLIYGQSNTTSPMSTANFGSTPKSSSNSAQAAPVPKWDFGDLGGSAFAQNLLAGSESAARVDNLKAQNDVLKQDAIMKAVQIQGQGVQNEISSINRDNLKNYSADMLEADLHNKTVEGQVMLNKDQREAIRLSSDMKEAAERILTQQSIRMTQEMERELKQLDIEMRRLGMNPSDPGWLRILTRWLQDNGAKMKQDYEGFMNEHFKN